MNLFFHKQYTRFENYTARQAQAHRVTPKVKTVYRCTDCGAEHPEWAGRCDVCGEWNTLVEEMAAPKLAPRRAAAARGAWAAASR